MTFIYNFLFMSKIEQLAIPFNNEENNQEKNNLDLDYNQENNQIYNQ